MPKKSSSQKILRFYTKLKQDLESIPPQATIDVRVLSRILGRRLNKKYHTKFNATPWPDIRDILVVSGVFNAWPENGPYLFEMVITYDKQTSVFEFTEEFSWNHLMDTLLECITHEYAHLEQYRKHKDKRKRRTHRVKLKDKDFDYYCSNDEIDAYSWSLAIECASRRGEDNLINPDPDSVFWSFEPYFKQYPWVRQRLISKSYTRLKSILP